MGASKSSVPPVEDDLVESPVGDSWPATFVPPTTPTASGPTGNLTAQVQKDPCEIAQLLQEKDPSLGDDITPPAARIPPRESKVVRLPPETTCGDINAPPRGSQVDQTNIQDSKDAIAPLLHMPTDPGEPAEYRLRFFMFNMANSSDFQSLGSIQGPGGRGSFEAYILDPFPDGHAVDVAFATLVETRLNASEWVRELQAKRGAGTLRADAIDDAIADAIADATLASSMPRAGDAMTSVPSLPSAATPQSVTTKGNSRGPDTIVSQNARREGKRATRRLTGWIGDLAAKYNGNLKNVLAFSSEVFTEETQAQLFGKLTEATVGGIAVPNPKKAFLGRTLEDTRGRAEGVRFCFVGAHFPIQKIAAAMEDPCADVLTVAKCALAKTLRNVLRKAARRCLVDHRTIIFIQGDLNSRTVLLSDGVDGAKDVLMEVLKDDVLQASIQHELDVCPGCFREVVSCEMRDLPVTYKFDDVVPTEMMPRNGCQAQLTLGDVLRFGEQLPLEEQTTSFASTSTRTTRRYSRCVSGGVKPGDLASDMYRRVLTSVGDAKMEEWGVQFKKHDFKAFRFPAAADRLIYWAPDGLAERLSWELPRRGYEVTHGQGGSDHKPVTVEVLLRILPQRSGVDSPQSSTLRRSLVDELVCGPEGGLRMRRDTEWPEELKEILGDDESDDSDSSSP